MSLALAVPITCQSGPESGIWNDLGAVKNVGFTGTGYFSGGQNAPSRALQQIQRHQGNRCHRSPGFCSGSAVAVDLLPKRGTKVRMLRSQREQIFGLIWVDSNLLKIPGQSEQHQSLKAPTAMATQHPTAMACLSLRVTPGHFGLFDVLKKLLFRENLTICKICKRQKVDHEKSGLSDLGYELQVASEGSTRCSGILRVHDHTPNSFGIFFTEPSISQCHEYHHLHQAQHVLPKNCPAIQFR